MGVPKKYSTNYLVPMSIELQNIDTNCNNCRFMQRDVAKFNSFNHLHKGAEKSSHRVNYGRCNNLDKDVSFLPNVCMPENKECFENRRK